MSAGDVTAILVLFSLLFAGCGGGVPEPGSPATSGAQTLSEIPRATTVSISTEPGWTRYVSINDVRDLAFAPDGTLWAITGGGLVHWDLSKETYTRHLIDAAAIAVATDGTVWLAAEDGVYHFDGATCQSYTRADGLSDGRARTVAVAPDGAVWVGTDGGVSRFDGRSWRSYPAPVPITDLAAGGDGEVWVATSQGVGRYVPAEDAWTTYTEEHGLPGLQVRSVAAGPEGSAWASILWEGVYRFDGSNWQVVEGVNCGAVADIALGPDGTPWIATTGGMHYRGGCLSSLDGDTGRDVAGGRGLAPISTVALGAGGVVAAGTNLGLGVYRAGEWRLLRDGPSYNRATSIVVTPDGAAWFAFGDHSASTHYPGVSRYDGQGWQYFLDQVEVTALAVAPDGSLWAGTVCDVREFDGMGWKTVGRCGEDLPVGGIIDMAFAADGAIWVANGFGLARFDRQSWTEYEKLANSVVAAPDGAIWINAWEGLQGSFYVARLDGEGWTNYTSADAFPGGFSVGAVTADGRVWGISPEGGLARFDGTAWSEERGWTAYPPPGRLSVDSVQAIARDGALWLHTSEGFARFDPGAVSADRWTTYSADNGLVCDGDCGEAIALAPDGAIWFGTTHFQPAQIGGVQ